MGATISADADVATRIFTRAPTYLGDPANARMLVAAHRAWTPRSAPCPRFDGMRPPVPVHLAISFDLALFA
jgi:hypothetical protein